MHRLLFILACCLATACSGSDLDSTRTRRGVMVIVVDCMRGGHTSLLGYDRETTPFLDSLAEESLVFERHYAISPDVLPSHLSLLTGCDPRLASRPSIPGFDGQNLIMPPSVPRLARTYLANGYRTAAFSDTLGFSARHGFGEGFEEFFDFREGEMDPRQDYGLIGVTIRFKQWLRGLDDDENWFAYLHVRDLERIWRQEDPVNDRRFAPRPELDFVPPLSAKSTSFFAVPKRCWNKTPATLGEYEARYDGNLRECDQNLGRIVSWLKRKGYWDTTTFVVTGAYGIAFGEDGFMLSSKTLAEGGLRVPWFVRPDPGLRVPVGQRIDQVTSAIDLAPTLIELSGLQVPKGMHGISHRSAIFGEGSNLREHAFAAGGAFGGFAVVSRREHFTSLHRSSMSPASMHRSYFGLEKGAAGERSTPLSIESVEPLNGRKMDLTLERTAELTEVGEYWTRWILKARDVVQGVEVDSDVKAELVRRGLIAD